MNFKKVIFEISAKKNGKYIQQNKVYISYVQLYFKFAKVLLIKLSEVKSS